jgi:hypothetical protein
MVLLEIMGWLRKLAQVMLAGRSLDALVKERRE